MNISNLPIILVAILSLAGCSTWSGSNKTGDNTDNPLTALNSFKPAQHKLIADNLLSVIAQFDDLAPLTTTVQISRAHTPFGRAVQKSIIDAGYGMQTVEGDLGVNLVRYLAENAETELGFKTTFRIEVGDYFAERDYQIIGDSVVPTSALRANGESENEIVVNDSVFDEKHFDTELSYITTIQSGEPGIRVITFDRGELSLDDTVNNTSTGLFASSDTNADNQRASRVESVSGEQNMYEKGSSNFTSIFRNYEDLQSGILVFADDSLVLGEGNKAYIKKLAQSFDPSSEIYSVVGCSHGKTSISEGNEILAKGRANRVKEALILSGVQSKYIFDEGCWAPSLHKVLPPRGVLITKKKRIDNT